LPPQKLDTVSLDWDAIWTAIDERIEQRIVVEHALLREVAEAMDAFSRATEDALAAAQKEMDEQRKKDIAQFTEAIRGLQAACNELRTMLGVERGRTIDMPNPLPSRLRNVN
jgi:hypothetical protein